ncbi:MAG: HlyD family efflux transporter periplasmic adaptor subunit, partial [bacterium]
MENSEHRIPKSRTWIGVSITICIFVFGFIFIAFYGRADSTTGTIDRPVKSFTVDGTLETDEVDVSSKLPGRISELFVDEGDYVTAGQTLAVLEAEEIDAKHDQAQAGVTASQAQSAQASLAVTLETRKSDTQVKQAEAGVEASSAALEMARQKLAALERGARPQEITQAEQGVAAAQAQFDTAKKTYARITNLNNEGIVSQQKADEIEMTYKSAEAQLNVAKARLDMAQEGARKEEVYAAREQVRQARAGLSASEQTLQLAKDARMMVDIRKKDVEAANQKIAASEGVLREVSAYKKQTTIIAPISGRISQRMSRAGEIVAPGYAIFNITRTDKFWVDAYVDENKFAGHSIGDSLTVVIPALGKTIPGKISR